MKYIVKNECPSLLQEYRAMPGATFDNMDSDTKKQLRESLAAEQGFLCCYCGKEIQADYHSVIEHFLPKGVPAYSHLQLDYDNLLCSCDGGEKERKGKCKRYKKLFPSHCDDKKGDAVLPLTPLDSRVEDQFSYDEEGHIYGWSEDAKAAIRILNLDCSTIVNRRKAAIEPYLDASFIQTADWAAVIDGLSRRDADGAFMPYCFAVIGYIKDNFLADAQSNNTD